MQDSCAKPCLARVACGAAIAVAIAACGGTTTSVGETDGGSGADASSADASTTDAASDASSSDSGARKHPDARLTWQGPGGFAGTGPAIVVDGSGSIRGWSTIHSFDPAAQPAVAPDQTWTVSGGAVDALFDTWSSASTSGLPHAGAMSDCYAAVYVAMCTSCPGQTVKYTASSQVKPELDAVFAWFDANIVSQTTYAYPKNYCNF
jgi:hypothetical protein